MTSFLRLLAGAVCAVTSGAPLLANAAPAAPSSAAQPSEPAFPVLKVAKEVRPVYPQRLLSEGVARGEVVTAVCVDETGAIADLLLVRYTHREFADVVEPALREWKFHPLLVDGKAVRAIAEVHFRFETDGVLVIHRAIGTPADTQIRYAGQYAFEPCAPGELDKSLLPKQLVKPFYPKELSDKRITGEVFIEFYIDETGRTRLPVATWSHHDVLSAIAANAVEQWRFEPPTRHGRPVIVRAKQKFTFVPESAKSPENTTPKRS